MKLISCSFWEVKPTVPSIKIATALFTDLWVPLITIIEPGHLATTRKHKQHENTFIYTYCSGVFISLTFVKKINAWVRVVIFLTCAKGRKTRRFFRN